jgi:hypothetical protein
LLRGPSVGGLVPIEAKRLRSVGGADHVAERASIVGFLASTPTIGDALVIIGFDGRQIFTSAVSRFVADTEGIVTVVKTQNSVYRLVADCKNWRVTPSLESRAAFSEARQQLRGEAARSSATASPAATPPAFRLAEHDWQWQQARQQTNGTSETSETD